MDISNLLHADAQLHLVLCLTSFALHVHEDKINSAKYYTQTQVKSTD